MNKNNSVKGQGIKNNNRTYSVNSKGKKNLSSKKNVTVYPSREAAKRKKKSFSIKNIDKRLIVGIAIIIGIVLLHSLLGTILTIGIFALLGIVFGITRLLDRTKSMKKKRKIINIVLIIFLTLCITGVIGVSGFVFYVIKSAPDFNVSQLEEKESTIIYDSEGKEIVKLGAELRENISYDELPEVFVDALVSIEDSRFFQHNGFDAPRFIKATLGQLAGNNAAGGGSTLSMQVIKNSFTNTKSKGFNGLVRKFTDIYLAVFKLEKNFTKEEIIEFYVNNHFLSSNAYGVEAASQVYFGKSARDMNLSEAAMIAGMFKAPSNYDPYLYPDKTYARRSQVLNQMVNHGYITREEADLANSVPITSLLVGKSTTRLAYQGYIDTVIMELKNKYGIDPNATPLLIYTNMVRSKQQSLDDIFNGKTFTWVNDVVESGVAVVDNATGKLIAVGAGRNKTTALSYNFATMSNRQIGSTAKPIFDYAPGMEYNNWSTYTQFDDSEYTYSNGVAINNSDRSYMGQITLRTALSQSRNIPALKAFQAVSNKKIVEFVTSLGITPEISGGKIHEAHAVGAFNGASPLQMASAYATFSNGGYYNEPLTVNKIIYRDTKEEVVYQAEKKQVMSDSTAFMITDTLITAVNSGLSNVAKVNGVTLAAKTGTSSFDDTTKKNYKLPNDAVNDAWIVGYDPDITISMWYGYENINKDYVNRSVPAVIQRGKLYRALGTALFTKDNQQFKTPTSVVKVGIEVGSNPALLPSANTPTDQVTYEYFKKGTEPTEVSTKYKKLDNVTNLKVSYDSATSKVNLSWSSVNEPSANSNYGSFGYRIYYNGGLIGFTTESSYGITATTNMSGTYRVVTCFEKFTSNQSDGTTYDLLYTTNNPTDIYTLKLNGKDSYTIASTGSYTDSDPAVSLLQGTLEVDVNLDTSLKTTVSYAAGAAATVNGVFSLSGSNTPIAKGKYTVTYTLTYNNKSYIKTRTIFVE